jgi:hypothetical protein
VSNGDNGPFLDQALTHSDNKMRFDLLKSWQQVGAKFFLWDYHFLGSAAIPLVETPYKVGNLKLLNKLGLLGVFVQSEETSFMFPLSYQGPWHKENFFTLRHWITYKLMSSPDSDVDVLTDTFFKGYFGPAAGKMREFYNFLVACQEKPREKRQLYFRNYTMDYLTPDFFVTADRLCQQAEAQCAPGSAELLRVRQERIRVDLGILELWGDLKRQLPDGAALPFNRDQVIDRLESAGRAVIAGRPWRSKEVCLSQLTNMVAYYRQPRLPEPFSKLDAAEYCDITWRCFPAALVGFPRLEDIQNDPKAALGTAILYSGKSGWENEPVVFKLDQLNFALAPAEFPTDDQYHFYKLGRMRFVDNIAGILAVELGKRPSAALDVARRLDDCERAAEWDVYVSAKIVTKVKGKKGVWLDRIFLVRAIPGTQRPDVEKAALKAYREVKDKASNAISQGMNKLE